MESGTHTSFPCHSHIFMDSYAECIQKRESCKELSGELARVVRQIACCYQGWVLEWFALVTAKHGV